MDVLAFPGVNLLEFSHVVRRERTSRDCLRAADLEEVAEQPGPDSNGRLQVLGETVGMQIGGPLLSPRLGI